MNFCEKIFFAILFFCSQNIFSQYKILAGIGGSAGFTSASLKFLAELESSLHQRGIKGGYTFIPKSRTYGQLRFSTLDALKLYEIMYNVPHRLFLHRKKAVFEKFKKMRL